MPDWQFKRWWLWHRKNSFENLYFSILILFHSSIKFLLAFGQRLWRSWSFAIPDVRGSNPVIVKLLYRTFFTFNCTENTKMKKKEAVNSIFFSKNLSRHLFSLNNRFSSIYHLQLNALIDVYRSLSGELFCRSSFKTG